MRSATLLTLATRFSMCSLVTLAASLVAVQLPGCAAPETGIDHTVLTGTLLIPPGAVEEIDPRTAPNDNAPQALGEDGATALSYRAVIVTGNTSSWTPDVGDPGPDDNEIYGDADQYGFSPVADGAFSVTLSFATGASTDTAAGADAVVYEVYIADAATLDLATGEGILAGGSTDGSAGLHTVEADLVAGTEYVLVIAGASNADGDVEVPYTVVLSGSAPGAGTVMVGAYLEGDPAVASDPVGGTTAQDWTFDAATSTWSGTYEILYLRSVVMPEVDTAAPVDTSGEAAVPSPAVDEALKGTIYLTAGTLTNLNGSPSAGALYSTVSVETSATDKATKVETALVLDGLFPKVIGVQATETMPDVTVAAVDANGGLDPAASVIQDLGMLSGLGYVDIIDGVAAMTGATSNDGNDADVYAFTVPEPMYARMTAGWPTTVTDIDFGVWGYYDGYGIIDLQDYACQTGSDPEFCETFVPLEPDTTYYVLALAYAGDPGDEPYHIELEWVP